MPQLSAFNFLEDNHPSNRVNHFMHELYIDGACRGNPGPASIGASLCKDGQEIANRSEVVGIQTNNVAEYKALLFGLQLVLENQINEVKVFSDSQLMVRQINGQYKVKDAKMKILYDEAKKLIAQFSKFSIEHILREKNTRADELANQALDNQ